ncbi:MAG: ABC transporter permease [Pseudoflavonifractor sp.]
MNFRQAVKLAAKSISARKGRTFLTMLGIIIGLAAVIILVTYAQGTTKQMLDLMQSMGTNQINVSAYKWTGGSREDVVFNSLYNYCKQMDDLVVGVTPNQYAWVNVKYGAKSSQRMEQGPQTYLGSDQWGDCNNATIAKGRGLSYLDMENLNQVIVLGSGAAEAFFNYADPIGETMTVEGVPFTVIGVYEPRVKSTTEETQYYKQLDNFILLPYTVSRTLIANGSTNIQNGGSEFIVKAKSASATTEAMTRLEGFLKGLVGDAQSGKSYGYYSVYSNNASIDSTNEAAKSQQMLLGGIAAISLLVGGIGIMNIMLVTVTERTREIGIRKAIGAERRSIIVQFLIEACMICGIGGIIGILVGYGGTVIVCKLTLGIILFPGAGIAVGSFIISVGLGIIFGLYPAIKASGLQPVEALRAD